MSMDKLKKHLEENGQQYYSNVVNKEKYQVVVKAVGIKFFGEVINHYPTTEDISFVVNEFDKKFPIKQLNPYDNGTLFNVIIEKM